jgi:hypothetical protein
VNDAADQHRSPLRELMAEAVGGSYVAFETLCEAKADPEGVVIVEGDDGGQIYIVVPAQQVLCAYQTLTWLLHDVDGISWPGNDDDSARIVFERVPVGATVAGGMGGGIAPRDPWIRPELVRLGLDEGSAPFYVARLIGCRRRVEQGDGPDGLHCAGHDAARYRAEQVLRGRSAHSKRLPVDLEHRSPGQPSGHPVDEVSYRSAPVRMDSHISAFPSNHPAAVIL